MDSSSENQVRIKNRVKNLFQFLFEVNRLRFRPERNLNEHVRVIKLSGIPEHFSINLIRPHTAGNLPENEFELRVGRAKTTRCPMPPDSIKQWLIDGWDDPTHAPKYSENQNHVDKDGNTITVFFHDDSERIKSFNEWLNLRNSWAEPEIIARNALLFFQQIYELYTFLENEGERVELMLGDGVLDWKARSSLEASDVHIHHPLLLKKVELLFDPQIPEFRVVDTLKESELYVSCLIDVEGLNVSGINQRQKDLSGAEYHPLGHEDTAAFFKALVQTISPTHGEFTEFPTHGIGDDPKIWREPILFARKRVIGITNAISSILEDIDSRTVFPPAFGKITGVFDEKWEGTGFGEFVSSNLEPLNINANKLIDNEVLLAKEANEEQLQIIRKLSSSGSVLVQGPPGTGKTHTIGNIIGHLLAQGKRILVTSHTPKALRVLRSQIPKDLQPLCVSVLGSDADARSQLELSISEINTRLSRDTLETLSKQILRRKTERINILERNTHLIKQLRLSMENEYRAIEIKGKSYTPADAARYVSKHEKLNNWLPGPVTFASTLPVSVADIAFLYSTNGEFTINEERDASHELPQISALFSISNFDALISEINNLLTTDLQFKNDLWDENKHAESSFLADLLEKIGMEFTDVQRKQTWRPYAIVAGMQGGTQRQVWENFISRIRTACQLSSKHVLNLHQKATITNQISLIKQSEIVSEIISHLEDGGKIGTIQLVTKSDWRKFIKTSSVAAGRPSHVEHFKALQISINLDIFRDELSQIWDHLITQKGGVSFHSLGSEPEQAAHALIAETGRYLDWYQCTWLPLAQQLKDAGLSIDVIFSSYPQVPSVTALYDIVEKVCIDVLPPIIEAQIRRVRLKECEESLRKYEEQLQSYGIEALNRGCISQLYSAVKSRNINVYTKAMSYTKRLHSILPIVQKRRALISKLEADAPSWASAIANRIPPHNEISVPGDAQHAWIWRQMSEELKRRNELNPQELQNEIDHNKDILREVTTDLIAAKTWAKQIDRLQREHSIKQALVGWLDAFKKLKSTQKIDIRAKLLSEARKLMKNCARAVPVWIMPLSAVAENFEPASTHFDVVIIDEASQADLNALIAIYQADKVIIVGDHEQVTPDAVGKDQSLVHNLIDTYLQEIPNSRLFDNRFSVYDLGRQAFGDAICLVEHFRCIPEIIAFSNKLSYNGRIRPLRESTSTIIKPPCIAYRVDGVCQNQTNLKEVETIVNFIKAMCKHPAYERKTIGVISLVGESQAYLIDRSLREALEPIDYNKRRIVCGNSAHFQGDERDIIFLSVIDSGKDLGNGPIAKKGEGAFEAIKKRYNVAASRARDQLWVVHSLDPYNDLKPEDIRRELILHALDPSSTIKLFEQEEPRTESQFEKDVLRILINRGYKVRTQWKVGYYRIDMVVEGNGKRLAVECDGDRWHPIEKLAEDMSRQAILERLNWKFVRIRGSEFYRNTDQAMSKVFDCLDAIGIHPCNDSMVEDQVKSPIIEELETIIASFNTVENDNESADSNTNDKKQQAIDGKISKTYLNVSYKISLKGLQSEIKRFPDSIEAKNIRDNNFHHLPHGDSHQLLNFPNFRHWFEVFDEIISENQLIRYEDFIRLSARKNGYQRIGTRITREIRNAFQIYKQKFADRCLNIME